MSKTPQYVNTKKIILQEKSTQRLYIIAEKRHLGSHFSFNLLLVCEAFKNSKY